MLRSKSYLPYVLIIICLFSTLVNAWVPITARTWVLLLLGCIVSFYFVPTYYRSRVFCCVVVYLGILILNLVYGDKYFDTLSKVMTEAASMIFPVSLLMYCISLRDYHCYKIYVEVFIMILLVAAVGTYFADQIRPQAVRLAAIEISTGEGKSTISNGLYMIGMTNYALPHALPVLIPALMLGVKNKKMKQRSRTLCILVLVAILSLIWFSAATTPLLFAVIVLVLSTFTPRGALKDYSSWFICVALVLGFILVFHDFFGNLFMHVSNLFSGEGVSSSFQGRFEEVGSFLQTGQSDGDLESRSERYSSSLQALYHNIYLGTNERVGGHSALIDRVAALGVVGVLPWIMAIYFAIKYTLKQLPSDIKLFYLEGISIGLAMLLTKNMANIEMWFCMFFVLPIMLILFSRSVLTR